MNQSKIIITILIALLFTKGNAAVSDSIFNELYGDEQLKDTTTSQKYYDNYFNAQLAFDQNNFSQTEFYLNECLKIDNNSAIHFQLYKLYQKQNKTDLAIKHINIALKQDPTNNEYLNTLVNIYWDKKDYLNVYKTALKLHKLDPDNSEYIYNIISSIKLIETFDSNYTAKTTLKYLKKLEEVDGYSKEIAFERLKIYLYQNKTTKALSEIANAIKKFPYINDFYIFEAQIYKTNNEYTKAISSLTSAIEIEPDNGNIIYYASTIYRLLNDTVTANNLISLALNAKNTSDDLRVTLLKPIIGQLYYNNQIDSIYHIFYKYTNEFSENNLLKEYYISFLEQQADTSNIVKISKELISKEPNNPIYAENILPYINKDTAYKYNLINYNDSVHNNDKWKFYKYTTYYMYNDSCNIIKSIKNLIPYVRNNTFSSMLYTFTGDFFLQNKCDTSRIFEMYDSALVKNPENASALNNYAYTIYKNKGDINKAEKMSAKSILLEPKDNAFLDTYACILFEKKEYFLAKFYIEQIFKNEKDKEYSASLYELYGDVLYFLNNKEKALEQWEKALNLDPNNLILKNKYETKEYHKQ